MVELLLFAEDYNNPLHLYAEACETVVHGLPALPELSCQSCHRAPAAELRHDVVLRTHLVLVLYVLLNLSPVHDIVIVPQRGGPVNPLSAKRNQGVMWVTMLLGGYSV